MSRADRRPHQAGRGGFRDQAPSFDDQGGGVLGGRAVDLGQHRDERDIASVAVRALTEDSHAGARYVLSGPEVLTPGRAAGRDREAIGRDLTWEELPEEDAVQALAAAWDDANAAAFG